jgi:transcriptional regulator with XRE-family HTH domain
MSGPATVAPVPEPPETPDARSVFGQNLRTARLAAGLTQERLGLDVGLHPTEVNRLERGRRNPGLVTMVRLAHGLGVPTAELVRGL